MEQSAIFGTASEQYGKSNWIRERVRDQRKKVAELKERIRQVYQQQAISSLAPRGNVTTENPVYNIYNAVIAQVLIIRKLRREERQVEKRLPDLVAEARKREQSADVLEDLGRIASGGSDHALRQARDVTESVAYDVAA